MEMENIVVDFTITDQISKSEFSQEFSSEVVIESSAFSGTEIITVIISTSAIVLDKILNFFIQNRKTLKETTIKIGSDQIELSGFTDEAIQKMIENGSLTALKELITTKNE